MSSELKKALEQISKDRGVSKEDLIQAIEDAVRMSALRKYGDDYDIEARYDEDIGEISLYQFKRVVEVVRNTAFEVSLADAKTFESSAEIGEDMGFPLLIEDMGRIAAQAAKQVLVQRMRDAEQQIIYDEFTNRRGDIVSGIVQRRDKNGWIINLGRTEALLPKGEQIPKEYINRGDKIQCLLLEVNKDTKMGAQLILSRAHPEYIHTLFKREVPEIEDGIIQVVSIVRDPGVRAKVAVLSRDKDVDPVGACVGVRGFRIQSVMQEVNNERIDIVVWNADIAIYARNALAPAVVLKVTPHEEENTLEVIVPDDQLSNAIGRRGQNVKLVSKMLSWKLDIYTENRYNVLSSSQKVMEQLASVAEIHKEKLFSSGYSSLEDLINASDEELLERLSISKENVVNLRSAINFVLPASNPKDSESTEDTDLKNTE